MTSDMSRRQDATPSEMVASVAQFLETQVLPAAVGNQHSFNEIAAAVDALRIVERELLADPTRDANARGALARLGFSDEAQLSAAIRNGDLDDRADEVTAYLRALAKHRLAVAHPGYQNE